MSTSTAGLSFGRYDVHSLRQPNAIEPFEMRTRWSLDTFLFTADEGAPTTYNHDQRKWSDAVPGAGLESRKSGKDKYFHATITPTSKPSLKVAASSCKPEIRLRAN